MITWSRTKIVATLGPSSNDPKLMERLIRAGTDVFRLNFAHGSHAEHLKRIRAVRRISRKLRHPIGILLDLPGPKIRVGKLPQESLELFKGQTVFLMRRLPKEKSEHTLIPVDYPYLTKDIRKREAIFIADGTIRLSVRQVHADRIECRVQNGGTVRSRNGINLPQSSLSLKPFTREDRIHLAFGLRHNVDFIGVSFVESAKDIKAVRDFAARKKKSVFVIAKIERRKALKNLKKISEATDGLMVARGDLGVEVPFYKIPGVQQEIIETAARKGKPVIVATQVLDSMIKSPRPTRAEATDISHAILGGADAIMLSGETAAGAYPLESVTTLEEVIRATEKRLEGAFRSRKPPTESISNVMAEEACHIAEKINAKAILVPTISGRTAARISILRPQQRIIALVRSSSMHTFFSIYWGISTLTYRKKLHAGALTKTVRALLKPHNLFKKGDRVIIASGSPGAPFGETAVIQNIYL